MLFIPVGFLLEQMGEEICLLEKNWNVYALIDF